MTVNPPASTNLADRIDALLPQTQCTQCGYDGCRPYAAAIAQGEAAINRCPPGGEDGVAALAGLLGRPPLPLDPECGTPGRPEVAVIDEPVCIGCTKCIQACPVDAIAGAAQWMHTVIEHECTGCGLCLPPCPVDCIDLVPSSDATPLRERAGQFRARYTAREARRARDERERTSRRAEKRARLAIDDRARKRDEIAAAVARSRARRANGGQP